MSSDNSSERKDDDKSEGLFGDVLKKVISVGVGAGFMTEEVVKKYINDLSLPKDLANGLIQNAKGMKQDFLKSIEDEARKQISKVDPKKLLEEVLNKYDIDVKVSFRPKDGVETSLESIEKDVQKNNSDEDA